MFHLQIWVIFPKVQSGYEKLLANLQAIKDPKAGAACADLQAGYEDVALFNKCKYLSLLDLIELANLETQQERPVIVMQKPGDLVITSPVSLLVPPALYRVAPLAPL